METLDTGLTSGVVSFLVEKTGGTVLDAPPAYADIPQGKTVVCVLDNGHGEVAVPCTSEQILADMYPPNSGLPRVFVMMDTSAMEQVTPDEADEAEAPEEPEDEEAEPETPATEVETSKSEDPTRL